LFRSDILGCFLILKEGDWQTLTEEDAKAFGVGCNFAVKIHELNLLLDGMGVDNVSLSQ
jgi:hypothetical protein